MGHLAAVLEDADPATPAGLLKALAHVVVSASPGRVLQPSDWDPVGLWATFVGGERGKANPHRLRPEICFRHASQA